MKLILALLIQHLGLLHDFHVSITQMTYREKALQTTVRVFTDDLEYAINANYQVDLNLGAKDEHPNADRFIKKYIDEHFAISTRDSTLNQQFLGKEVELQLTYLYLEIALNQAPKELEVYNALFFDRFDDQSNIVNVTVNDELESAFLSKSQPREQIQFKP